MATITGTINAIDASHQAILANNLLRAGSLSATDSTHSASVEGLVIADSSRLPTQPSFLQGAYLDSNGLTLTLRDSTYIDGSYSGDGTYFDSTYAVRLFTPVSIDYSIWFKAPPDRSDSTLIGYRNRTPIEENVGRFYANMNAPDNPGHYEIRWRYLKDTDSFAHEIVGPFTVITQGVKSEPDYTGA